MDPPEVGGSASMNHNYIQVDILLSRVSEVLQKVFRTRWQLETSTVWDSSDSQKLIFISGIGERACRRLTNFQQNEIRYKDVVKWDIPILAQVLTESAFTKVKFDKGQEIKKLNELKNVRNQMAHCPNKNIDDNTCCYYKDVIQGTLLYYGDTIEAIQAYTKFTMASAQDGINKNSTQRAHQLKVEGNSLYSRGDFDGAIKLYTEALVLSGLSNRDSSVLHSNRSAAHLKKISNSAGSSFTRKMENVENQAVEDGKMAVKFDPDWGKAHFRLGEALYAFGKTESALKSYNTAVSLDPFNEEFRGARDKCAVAAGLERRLEHLDPSLQPKTEEERLKEFSERTGVTIPASVLKKLPNLRPGDDDVRMGHRYREGVETGYAQNLTQAFKLYAKAASKGNADGIYHLALLYKYGNGVKQDVQMAVQLLKDAAQQNHILKEKPNIIVNSGVAEAEHSLGLAYEEGSGVDRDYIEAARYYTRSSEHGCPNASNNLAFLYRDGKGVAQDPEKAIQYWKLSASRNSAVAMSNLALHYLHHERDVVEARKWEKLAISNEEVSLKYNEDYQRTVVEVEKETKGQIQELQKFEKKMGLSSGGKTFRQRMLRMMSLEAPELTPHFEVLKTVLDNQVTGPSHLDKPNPTFPKPMLISYAKKGSVTAKSILEATLHFEEALKWTESSSTTPGRNANIVKHLAQALRDCQLVVTVRYDEWSSIFSSSFSIKKSDLDRDARLCYGFLRNDVPEVAEFSRACVQKYPDEKHFYVMYSSMCAFLRDYQEGARAANEGLVFFPNDFDLLYAKAGNLKLQQPAVRTSVVVKAYEEFLAHAPKDERKIPEALYCIGYLLLENDNEKQAEEYFKRGEEAEKLQLPPFLPYKSNSKDVLKAILDMANMKFSGVNKTLPTKAMTAASGSPPQSALTDPMRVDTILSHRQALSSMMASKEILKAVKLNMSQPPKNQQRKPVSKMQLKEITFADIEFTVDHVCEGRILHVTSIETPMTGMAGIHLVLQDENFAVSRGSIYNFHTEEEEKIEKEIGIGSKLSIINPYLRLAGDGKSGIRVDDAKCLIIKKEADGSCCRYCGKPDSVFTCSRCQKAKYCSKQCQADDWKILKHKLICSKN